MREYAEHLYGNDLDGYVQALQLHNGQAVKVINVNKGIADVFQELEGQEDTFVTPNSFYIPFRSSKNIRHFRALYIDLDLDNRYGKQEAVYDIYILSERGEIPKPTMIIDSGRGIHVYWRIENAPAAAVYTWQELEDFLYKKLEHIGADIKATDAARLLRLPNTINSKNKEPCRILFINENKYSMRDLREQYLEKSKVKSKTSRKVKNITYLYNSYSLHATRAFDIETLCRLRNYQVTGYRNTIIHCFAYWKGIYIRDPEDLKEEVFSLNNKFTEPLKDTEVNAVLRSTEKAVKAFIDYEQGMRMGFKKRVSKGMKDKGGYWYKNETLIERLGITEEEQRARDIEGNYLLKTIIGKAEKYRRSNEKRTPRINGLTPREQSAQENLMAIQELKSKGLNNTEIAKELGLSVRHVRRIINK